MLEAFGGSGCSGSICNAMFLLKCQFALLALWFLVSSAQKMWSNSRRTEVGIVSAQVLGRTGCCACCLPQVQQESLDSEPVPGSESGHLLVANAAPCGPRGKWARAELRSSEHDCSSRTLGRGGAQNPGVWPSFLLHRAHGVRQRHLLRILALPVSYRLSKPRAGFSASCRGIHKPTAARISVFQDPSCRLQEPRMPSE